MKKLKSVILVLIVFILSLIILLISNPFIIPKTKQKLKLANELSFEYVLLIDKLDRLNAKYSKNPSESIKEKIQETENKILLKYPDQIGPL